MSKTFENARFATAKAEADKVEEQILDALRRGRSFRVEAGAGSGKTYSLNRVVEWVQANKREEFQRKKQNAVCVTYTNAAVEVIRERLTNDSFIEPSTIHAFAWNAIERYQSALIDLIENDESLWSKEAERVEISKVKYTLGSRYTENGVHYLYHNDVLDLFCRLLDRPKFRRVFADKYPLILIDEYQDSYRPIVDRFIEYFIAKERGPQFGFFGDAWQTIYSSNNACGLIECEKLEVIQKNANFRSAPKIVEVLNRLRPELPQRSAVDGFEGEVYVVTCDDFKGERRSERGFQGDLPQDELKERINLLNERVKATTSPGETLKTLMITHKVLAAQQGYARLLEVLGDGLRNNDDAFLDFFMNVVEPIYAALTEKNTRALFETLGVKRRPITRKSEKACWNELRQKLEEARERKTLDVLNVVESSLIPLPPKVEEYLRRFRVEPDAIYVAKTSATLRDLFDLDYRQFINAIEFLRPESAFSTEHGVKGEEYDNIIFVVSKGWIQYQFETYAPMITGDVAVPKGKEGAFERNRNLFYVSCSRAKKRLILFVSLSLDAKFQTFLTDLVGEERVLTFDEFLTLDD